MNLAKFSVLSVVEDNTVSFASYVMSIYPQIIIDDAATEISESVIKEALTVASKYLTKWCDADKITCIMENHKNQTQEQYCCNRFIMSAESALINRRYADAFKQATEEFKK